MQKFNYTARKHPRTLHEAFPVTAYQWWFPPEKKPLTGLDLGLWTVAILAAFVTAYIWLTV